MPVISHVGRNIEIVTLDSARYLVSAHTASIGTGVSEGDVTIVFPYILGRIRARTVLGELFAIGAELSMLNITVFSSQSANGEEIVRGIRDELSTASESDVPLQVQVVDDPENQQTGLVIQAVGTVYKNRIKIASSRPGDFIYALGVPKKTGDISSLDDREIAKLFCITELAGVGAIHEVMLLENQTISGVVQAICRNTGLTVDQENPDGADLDRVGDAGTCIVFTSSNRVTRNTYEGIRLFYLGRMRG